HFSSHDHQISAEIVILPHDLATDPVERGLEAQSGVDAYQHQVEHVRKGDAKTHLQLPCAARDVGIRPQHREQHDESHHAQFEIPFTADQECFGKDVGRDR